MSTKHRAVAGLVAAAMTATTPPAFAWSNQGHMVTGAIAYDDLARSSPALVAEVEKIMASHPDHARFEKALAGYSGQARTRRLFEQMARWPDDARGGSFDHPAWHYWLRLVPSRTDPITLPPRMLALTAGEAAEAYALNLATVRDAYAPAAERAVALCWVFHLTGDVQQPLHAGHLVSKRFPLSDRAGQSAFVRANVVAAPVNLHQFWDDAIGGDEDGDANVEAVRQRLGGDLPRADLNELNGKADAAAFRDWAEESLALARSAVYQDAAFEGAARPEAAPILTPDYLLTRKRVGERRIALGGHRIADAVRAALAP
ncbi:MAG: S1/P1 nuclease [Caulobacteraceae bacterium]|nr:S1/P1 nuclease [Caulobacteraceae bacterium]